MELKRRDFLKILGGATVATALPGCTQKKPQSLIPYITPHEEIVVGQSVWYAGVCRECPAGCGIHVRVREGRAVKVEGNPVHPVNQGGLCARGQASLQGLYNPDRIQHPMKKKTDGTWETLSWEQAEQFVIDGIRRLHEEGKGSGIAFMTQHMTGSLDTLVDEFLSITGSKRRMRYEPFAYESIKQANAMTFGKNEIPSFEFSSAKYILSFGADFLETWLSPVAMTRKLTTAREFDGQSIPPYVYIGPRLSMTATNADEWIAPRAGTEQLLALGLVNIILTEKLHHGISNDDAAKISALVQQCNPQSVAEQTGVSQTILQRIAREFAAAEPSLALGGGTCLDNDSSVDTLIGINLLNYVCGNIGTTVFFDRPQTVSNLNTYAELTRLVRSMEQQEISALFFTDVNPAYSTPPSLHFTEAMKNVPLSVAFSSFMDETTAQASIIFPIHTPLESWGDYEPTPHLYGLMQPVMQPVFATTRMLGDILLSFNAALSKQPPLKDDEQPFLKYVRNRWKTIHSATNSREDFDSWWVSALANGGVFSSSQQNETVKLSQEISVRKFIHQNKQSSVDQLELMTYASLSHYDGRGANRPWLQELPDPMTQMTWDSWVEIHPEDAKKFDIKRGDTIQLTTQYGNIELPAYVYPGIRQGTIAVPIGQGHTEYGRYAKQCGANVIQLLPSLANTSSGGLMWSGIPVNIVNKGENKPLADVAGSDYLHGRNIVQVITIEELLANSTKKIEEHTEDEQHESMYPAHEHPEHRWGMTIDLDKCTGCSACVTACYAENNVPVVGKKQVELGRELSWIRIERFFDDPPSDPSQAYKPNAEFLPMMCQQCDSAPCEPVCPVYAAYHTPEGLNAQVYNRCVGTRYCANNCPYKVRRFNWFDYEWPEPLNWQLNPDVTVRSKGVMEKCTFCVQRIVEAKGSAKKAHKSLQDGDIVPACQQACPAQAIVFGDLKDPKSKANLLREKNQQREYRVLEELNTQPAIAYLKEIRTKHEAT